MGKEEFARLSPAELKDLRHVGASTLPLLVPMRNLARAELGLTVNFDEKIEARRR